MSEPPLTLSAGDLVAGKLRILRVLGMGGMGVVYEVEHEITRHHRALKLLRAHLRDQTEVVARFLREASAAGRIGNPHIVETFDAGTLDNGQPYLVMELLQGETLSTILHTHGRLTPDALIPLILQACAGMSAAHQAGIVHRDLKPENLFVVRRGDNSFLKVLDFGISKFDANPAQALSATREGTTIGTPYYMSPEQVMAHREVDARTDVYALGVILYECLSGRRPFEASNLPQLALLIHQGRAVPLTTLCPDILPELGAIVEKAMACAAEERFRSMDEMGLALRELAIAQGLDVTVPHPATALLARGPTPTGASSPPAAETLVAFPGSRPPPLQLTEPSPLPAPSIPTAPGSTRSIAAHAERTRRSRRGWMLGALLACASALTAVRVWQVRALTGEPPAASTSPSLLPAGPSDDSGRSLDARLPSANQDPSQNPLPFPAAEGAKHVASSVGDGGAAFLVPDGASPARTSGNAGKTPQDSPNRRPAREEKPAHGPPETPGLIQENPFR